MRTISSYVGRDFDTIVADNPATVLSVFEKTIDTFRKYRVAQMTFGWVFETSRTSMSQTVTIETLMTYTGRKAVLTHRNRIGPCVMPLFIPERDRRLPVGCLVNLGGSK